MMQSPHLRKNNFFLRFAYLVWHDYLTIYCNCITLKHCYMAYDRKDPNEYSNLSDDIQRDLAAKEGPSEPLGNADDNHNIPHPYNDDIQTQLAAKSTANKKQVNKKNNDNTTSSGM